MTVIRDLHVESEAARSLLLNLRDILSDDEDASADAIEGETNLLEAIDGALARLLDLEDHAEAIKARIDDLKARKARFDQQSEMIRAALSTAIGMAGLKKVERPEATLSLRAVAPSVVVIEEADIPSEFFEPQPPKLDKRALLAALKEKRQVPGAELSNGGESLSVHSK